MALSRQQMGVNAVALVTLLASGAPATLAQEPATPAAGSPQTQGGRSAVAFKFEALDLGLEGIAYDPQSRSFFVSSSRQRKVIRRDADGRVSDFSRPDDGLLPTVALGVDAARRRLWVTSADDHQSFLAEYDLSSGRMLRRVPPPANVTRPLLSDLTVGTAGEVFVADPLAGRVYVLRPGARDLVTLTDRGPIRSAQGMAASPDGRFLFVADYAHGVVRVDPQTGAASLLPAPADAATKGIDGLVLAGSDLIGIQNGIEPHRVVRLRLDDARARITAVETLEQRHPEFDEPTLGVVVDGALYYVANSQSGRVRPAGEPEAARRAPAILRLPLGSS